MTLVHADSTKINWADHLVKPWKVCTVDPPYGVNYQSRRGRTRDHDLMAKVIANDATVEGAAGVFLDVMSDLCGHSEAEAELYVFTRWDIVSDWVDVVRELELYGFKYKALLVWDKGGLGMGDIDASWCPSYELIIYAKKGRRDLNHQRESVLRFDRPPAADRIHPTEKPVSLLEELIKVSSDPGDLIVDPFAGSASAVRAALNLDRLALGVESDEERYLRASARLQQQLLF